MPRVQIIQDNLEQIKKLSFIDKQLDYSVAREDRKNDEHWIEMR